MSILGFLSSAYTVYSIASRLMFVSEHKEELKAAAEEIAPGAVQSVKDTIKEYVPDDVAKIEFGI